MTRLLRWCVGFVLIAGGGLKAWALGTPGFDQTLVWHMAGGTTMVLLGLVTIEVILGTLLIVHLWPRATAALVLAALMGLSGVILWHMHTTAPDDRRACGCLGVIEGSSGDMTLPLTRNLVIAGAVLLSTRWSFPASVAAERRSR